MLLVCPSCATSYMIDASALGSEGRTVRCARCKATWFASMRASDLDSFVDDVIAEAQAESEGVAASGNPATVAQSDFAGAAADEFAGETFAAGELPQPAPEWASDRPAGEVPEFASDAPLEAAAPGEPPSISDAPPLAPPIDHAEFEQSAPDHELEDIETFAARRQRMHAKRKKSSRRARWTALVLVLFAVNVALVGARNEVVRYLPQTASLFAAIGLPVNLRGLVFEDVRISKETQDSMTILLIEGRIVSTGNRVVQVPRLRFAARNAAGQEIYSWNARPERSTLGPGESMTFHSRLAAPPADVADVMVRFFTAHDVAGEK